MPTGIRTLPSGLFQARLSKGTGVLVERTFTTIEEATAWRAGEQLAWKRTRHRGPTVSYRDTASLSVAQFWARWLAGKTDLAPGTRAMYETHWRNHIEPTLGRLPLVALENEYVLDEFARDLAATTTVHGRAMAASTQARILSIVSAMLSAAVKARLLS